LSFSYNFWESEWDLDLVSDFYEPAGLAALEGKAKEKAKQKQAQSKDGSASKTDNPAGVDEDDDYPILSLHASQCADIDLVREHLDGGVLRELVKQWKAKMEGNDDDDKLAAFHRGYYGYQFMLLGACAMTLGCKLECDFKELLIKRYRTSGLMRDALYMMQLALGDGPDRYKDTPYDFWSKGLVGADPEEYEEDETAKPPFIGRKVWPTDVCGGCGAEDRLDGEPLLACGKCKRQKYCSRVCQQARFEQHKRVCNRQ
jgi:hypothetical protein